MRLKKPGEQDRGEDRGAVARQREQMDHHPLGEGEPDEHLPHPGPAQAPAQARCPHPLHGQRVRGVRCAGCRDAADTALLVCRLGVVEYRRGAGAPGAPARRAPGRGDRRRPAAARAPARLHPRPPLGGGGAADGRGLVPRPGHRRRRRRPRRAADLPRARASSSATRSCGSATWSRTCARWRRRSSPPSPRRASTRTPAPRTGPAYTGVWVQDRKIASLGVHLSRGVTTHGFAVNVENDLQPFEWAVPCGLDGVRMTSRDQGARHGPAGRACPASRTRMSARVRGGPRADRRRPFGWRPLGPAPARR